MTRGYVLITTEVGKASEVVERLRHMPGVTLVDVVTGPYDIVAVLEGADTNAIGKLVLNTLHGIPNLRSTTTLIALS
jgi:DNA-binding Lrp family transcriptional regulator